MNKILKVLLIIGSCVIVFPLYIIFECIPTIKKSYKLFIRDIKNID